MLGPMQEEQCTETKQQAYIVPFINLPLVISSKLSSSRVERLKTSTTAWAEDRGYDIRVSPRDG